MTRSDGRRRVVVSGSFRKHWQDVKSACSDFKRAGAVVVSPTHGEPLREDAGFVYLEGDKGSPGEVEQEHLDAIGAADLLYVVNPDGHLGPSVALEIGYALARATPVFSAHDFREEPHRSFVPVKSISDALAATQPQVSDPVLPESPTLDQLQEFYKQIAQVRRFHRETPMQALMLLVEEIGELAKAIRTSEDLTISASSRTVKDVSLELADCLNYVLHLGNQTGVNLYKAFQEKERINASKKWAKPSRL